MGLQGVGHDRMTKHKQNKLLKYVNLYTHTADMDIDIRI